MRDNRGFSLTELLITFAILSVVITTVASLMLLGSKQYTKGSADASMQKEAQLVVNQIEDMFMDINGGVNFKTETNKNILELYNVTSESGINVYTCEVITWEKDRSILNYDKYNVGYDNVTNQYSVGSAVYTDQLMAENITDFTVDLTDTRTENGLSMAESVRINLSCKGDGDSTTYSTSPVVTLRNRLTVSDTPTVIFENTPVVEETLSLYMSKSLNSNKVPITSSTSVKKGGEYQFFAILSNSYDISSEVTWTISTGGTQSSIDDRGWLFVGEAEPNSALLICATYGTKTATAEVMIEGSGSKEILSVDIIREASSDDDPFKPVFSSNVKLNGFSEAERNALIYTWTVSEPGWVDSFNGSSKKMTLPVKRDVNIEGKKLVVTLTVSDGSGAENSSASSSVEFLIPQVGDSKDSYITRGIGAKTYEYASDSDDYESYEVYFCDEKGDRLWSLDYLVSQYVVIHSSYARGFVMEIKEGLPANRDYYLKYVAHYAIQTYDYERIFYIPGIKLIGQAAQTTWSGFEMPHSGIDYRVYGYNLAGWGSDDYIMEVQQIISNAPAGANVEAELTSSTPVSGDGGLMRADVEFKLDGDIGEMSISDIKVHSIKVKIQLASNPDVFAYSTLTFN